MTVVPWEFDLNKRNAIEVKSDFSGYIPPAQAKMIALDKMFKVTTISAEFMDYWLIDRVEMAFVPTGSFKISYK